MKDITLLDPLFEGLNLDDPADLIKAEENIKRIYEDAGRMDTKLIYNAAMAEKMFMKVMNTSKMGNGNAISVFQYESGQWKQLTLNPDGTIHKEPCP